MLFTSPTFIIFLSLFVISLLLIPRKYSPFLVFISCIIFYSFNSIDHILAMFWVVLCSLIFNRNTRVSGVLLILLPLAYFKYFEFFSVSLLGLSIPGKYFPNSIPPGISFVTFTGITFILVKERVQNWSIMNNLVLPVNYLLFFPQVIAGPIVRPHELLNQLKEGLSFNKEYLKLGFFLVLIGLIKKFFIADQLGLLVDNAYRIDSSNSFIGIIFFPWQIYFDFSAYTDMALGLAYIFGIKLPVNFNAPYSAISLTEFWRRWHMTLSFFFRDYVYKFLGGSRNGAWTLSISLMSTFILSGLWHGANWNFILWGALNGLMVLIEKFLSLGKGGSILYFITVQIVIILLWVIFRLPLEQVTGTILSAMVDFGGENLNTNILCLSLVLIFFSTHRFDVLKYHKRLSEKLSVTVLAPITMITLIIGMFVAGGSSDKFIYFDF